MDESIRQWIKKNLDSGYNPQQLRRSLEIDGFDPYLVDEYLSYNESTNSNIDIPNKKNTDNITNIILLSVIMLFTIVLFVSPFLNWIDFETVSGNTGSITGYQTPFGKSILFVSTSIFVLVISSKFLSRKFLIGVIALSVFSIGILAITYVAIDGIVTTMIKTSIIENNKFIAGADGKMSFGMILGFIASVCILILSLLNMIVVKN